MMRASALKGVPMLAVWVLLTLLSVLTTGSVEAQSHPGRTIASSGASQDGEDAPHTLEVAGGVDPDHLFGRLVDLATTQRFVAVLDASPIDLDHHVLVFDRSSGNLIGSAGRPGQGPGELQFPEFVVRGRPSKEEIWVRDSRGRRLLAYDLEDWSGTPSIELVDGPERLNAPMWAGDELLSTGFYPQALLRAFRIADAGPELMRSFGEWPFDGSKVSAGAGQAAQVVAAISPRGDRIAVAYTLKSLVQIYGGDGDPLGSVAGPVPVDFTPPLDQIAGRFRPRPETRFAYVDVTASEEFVFALFSGRLFEESIEARAAVHQLSDHVHVFTWDGSLAGVLDLGISVSRISIDPDGRTLYGIREAPEPGIVEFSAIPLTQLRQ